MFRLQASNFRVLRHVDWSPEGVCLLVGPNGAGKTTLLRLLRFLRVAALQNVPNGLRAIGALSGLRCLSAGPHDLVRVEVCVDEATWQIAIDSDNAGSASSEVVSYAGQLLAQRHMGELVTQLRAQKREDDQRSSLKLLLDVDAPPALGSLMSRLADVRVYPAAGGISTWGWLREGMFSVGDQADLYLSPLYDNAFTVLRNWRDIRKYRPQFDQVMADLRRLFPGDFYDLEFQPKVGVFRPGHEQAIPIQHMSDGFFATLLHLCAAAGMKPGGLLAIDQIEDNLHPAAIAGLIDVLRRWAAERHFTVVLTTHSPYVLDLFDDTPGQVFVMEPGQQILPVRLTELHEPAWLAHFKLGSLYGVEFSRQAGPDHESSGK